MPKYDDVAVVLPDHESRFAAAWHAVSAAVESLVADEAAFTTAELHRRAVSFGGCEIDVAMILTHADFESLNGVRLALKAEYEHVIDKFA